MNSENPTTALVKTSQSPALARVSNQLALTDKLLAKSEETILKLSQKNGKWGFCDQFGSTVIDYMYEEVDILSGSGGLLKVSRFTEWGFTVGYINRYGKEIVPLIFHKANYFCEDLVAVMHNFAWGFVDHIGSIKIPLRYEAVEDFSEGLAGVKKHNSWGFINKLGNIVIPFSYDYVDSFQEDITVVGNNNKHGFVDKFKFINKAGNQIITAEYKGARLFSEGLAAVSLPAGQWGVYEIWGFIDKSGATVIPFQYKDVSYAGFLEDLVGVEVATNKWGFIDKFGELIIQAKYSYVGGFYNGRSEIVLNCKRGYIDKNGVEYWEE